MIIFGKKTWFVLGLVGAAVAAVVSLKGVVDSVHDRFGYEEVEDLGGQRT